jgi:hypothetical protein
LCDCGEVRRDQKVKKKGAENKRRRDLKMRLNMQSELRAYVKKRTKQKRRRRRRRRNEKGGEDEERGGSKTKASQAEDRGHVAKNGNEPDLAPRPKQINDKEEDANDKKMSHDRSKSKEEIGMSKSKECQSTV